MSWMQKWRITEMEFLMIDQNLQYRRVSSEGSSFGERRIKVLFIVFAVIQRVLSCEFLLPKKTKPSKKYHRDLMLRFHKQTQKHVLYECVCANCGYYFWVWTWVLGKLCRCWVMTPTEWGLVRSQLNHKRGVGENTSHSLLSFPASLTKAGEPSESVQKT